jgi:hypothetical protein
MATSIYLTNLNRCEPSSAISTQWENRCWRAVEYETVNGVKGQMLMATTEIDAPPLTLPMNKRGWYRIFLGLGCPTLNAGASASVKVKLTDDPCYSMLQATGRYWWMEFREYFWKEADLTGQSFHFAKPKGIHNGGAIQVQSYIAYVRLEPLSDQEVQQLQQNRGQTEHQRLIGTEDGWSAIAMDNPTTIEELKEHILPYQHSDVRTVLYNAANGDCVNYPETNVGTAPHLSDRPIYPRPLDRAYIQSMEAFREKKIDPVGVLCDFAHELGLEFHATVRTGSFICDPPFDEFETSDFYRDHPEFRCRDKDGREIPRLSYAFPEVRQHMLNLYCEIAERNIDGFGWIFVRGLPVLLYEQPLIDGFIKQYGLDPRQLPDDDDRVCTYRASIFTDFVLKTIQTLNERRAKQGRKPLKFSVIVPATCEVNYRLGLDITTWVKQGLIDILGVDWSIQDRNCLHNESSENLELDYFLEVVRGTPCLLSPRIGYFDEEKGPQKMAELYAKGIDSGLIWDTVGCYLYSPSLWELVRRYGHKELVREWAQNGIKPDMGFIKLKTLGGCTMDKFPGNLAY